MVFVERIEKQLAMLHDIAVPAKFGGATGNFNAHRAAYPQYDWVAFANKFVTKRWASAARSTPHKSSTTTTSRPSSTT